MLKLGAPAVAGWQDLLEGVRVRFAPIGFKAVRAARRAVAMALQTDGQDFEEAGDALSRELIRRGILEWEGIGDAQGAPIAPQTLVPVFAEDGTPALDTDGQPALEAAVELFLRDLTAFEAADRVYVRPWTDREREKNDYAGSVNGTSETPARDIARTSADTLSTDAASPTSKPRRPKPGRAART